MAKYFTLSELTYSSTANKYGIKNQPSLLETNNLNGLMSILDIIRTEWGSAIKVSSGYRCKRLNSIVGGVKNSNHLYGTAADLQPVKGRLEDFFPFVRDTLIRHGIDWDEIIYERSGNTKWLHFAYKKGNTETRRKKYISITN